MEERAVCPVCDAELTMAEGTVTDELLECEECGSELVVSGVSPYELEEAPQAEEDWGE